MNHAELELIDELREAFNNQEDFLGIFIDFSKAFDTVDHEILLNNLCFYGIKSKNIYKYENMSNRGSKTFLQIENNT